MENVNFDCKRYKVSDSASFEKVVKNFRKKVNSCGVLREYRDNMHHMTKAEKKALKRKRNASNSNKRRG